MIIDLDFFKDANDKFGHSFGDETLMYFSSSIRLGMEYDYIKTMVPKFVFRYGGDEFIMVFPGKNSSEAYVLAERILLNIKKRPFLFRGNRFKMSFSGGISTYPEDSKNIEEIIEMADKAMYVSKKRGKGTVTEYSKIEATKKKLKEEKFIKYGVTIILILIITLFNFRKQIFIGNAPKSEPANISTIYFKSGGNVKGVVLSDSDPMSVDIVINQKKYPVLIKKSYISKIVKNN